MSEDRAEQILREFDRLKSKRAEWENYWQELANYMLPRKSDVLNIIVGSHKRTAQLLDTTAMAACEKFARGLASYLCPPTQRWFGFAVRTPELRDDWDVNAWLDEAADAVHRNLALSNFSNEIFEIFIDLGVFGTGCVYVEPGVNSMFFFDTAQLREYYIKENYLKQIDTLIRRRVFTARQAVQAFKILSDEVRTAAGDPKTSHKPFEFIQAVFPREDYDETKRDFLNMPWASLWIEVKGRKLVQQGGYRSFPFSVPRWLKLGGEIYGWSPGMAVFPDTKMTNTMWRTVIDAAEKATDPALLAPSEAFVGELRTMPGAVNYYQPMQPGMRDAGVYAMPQVGNPLVGLEMINQRQGNIKSAFYNDLFLLLNEMQPPVEMTATEVQERIRERVMMLAPSLGRLQSELFNPLITRCLDILLEQGALPTPPENLGGEIVNIEYISELALKLKEVESGTLIRTISLAQPLIENNQLVMDNLNDDRAFRGIAQRQNMPADWLRTEEERDALRQARADKQEQMAALEAAPEMAKAVPKLGKAPESGSPLDVLTRGAE